MFANFFFVIIPYITVNDQFLSSHLSDLPEKYFQHFHEIGQEFPELFPPKRYPANAKPTIVSPQPGSRRQVNPLSSSSTTHGTTVKSAQDQPKRFLQKRFKIGDNVYDLTVRKAPGYEELSLYQKPKTSLYLVKTPETEQQKGSGDTADFSMVVGGKALPHLSYPFGVDFKQPSLDISFPEFPNEPFDFDHENGYSSFSEPEVLAKHDDLLSFEFPFDSKYCASVPKKHQKECMKMIPCEKRTSCLDCTYDFNCFWCSSKLSCMPSKTFGFDSFTGQNCPASDMYYFHTCRIKSFIVMFILIFIGLGIIFLTIVVIFALIWRKSRRGKIYNTIRQKEKDLVQDDQDVLVD